MTAFLANENISGTTVRLLRDAGHDVVWIAESFPSISDEIVLSIARLQRRIILTFDADYGELIFGKKMSPPAGVIFFRLSSFDPGEPAILVLRHLAVSSTIFEDRFSVLTDKGLRYKLL